MTEDIEEMQRLLREIAEHMQRGRTSDWRLAVAKLKRLANLATTLALAIDMRRCRR